MLRRSATGRRDHRLPPQRRHPGGPDLHGHRRWAKQRVPSPVPEPGPGRPLRRRRARPDGCRRQQPGCRAPRAGAGGQARLPVTREDAQARQHRGGGRRPRHVRSGPRGPPRGRRGDLRGLQWLWPMEGPCEGKRMDGREGWMIVGESLENDAPATIHALLRLMTMFEIQ